MRVFVTGATGFIGTAVVSELLAAGHEVLGLARSDAAAGALTRQGAGVHRGELSDLESLAAGARACDGVIHLAFVHDFSAYATAAETDRGAIAALAGALEGSGKPFVSTSGTALLAPGRIGTEQDAPSPDNPLGARATAEDRVLAAAGRGVRSSVVRLPPSVHGAGDHGFVPMLIQVARRTGVSAFVADGANRWPAVHRLDAARLFRLALERAAPGTRLHGVAEEGLPIHALASVIGEGLGVPVRSLSREEAAAHFGWLAGFIGVDNPVSSALTRGALGWNPQGAGLLTDLRESGYFA
ncbi:SDR family oxidoreductase [Pyxidicoccus xibeiensis]|uniref:SDR family oxidoreductase n=1 Tax=Pyxidicoccus xibeiensis TaxID=2906759 RepID=UPI0020A77E23|nr:SDR family oxidoreductase [Pyxidicoccus xibeiensis]MCP3139418.1 SDR family oxidoreductase [Pyxidicoccus xibeiensis]